MNRKLYLGRRLNSWIGYELGTNKGTFNKIDGWTGGEDIRSFCNDDFEKYTGVKLKPGELVEVESIRFKIKKIQK